MTTIGCTHRKVTTYVFVDGNQPAGLWACADCGHKFEPVNISAEQDAERYRWLRSRAYKDGATLAIDVAVIDDVAIGDFGEFIDATADAAIAAARAVGAA